MFSKGGRARDAVGSERRERRLFVVVTHLVVTRTGLVRGAGIQCSVNDNPPFLAQARPERKPLIGKGGCLV
jgi:hypothetical protein